MTQAYLYKWTELSTGKWYIGSRTSRGCHPGDGYICSSKTVKPLIQANPQNWEREILVISTPEYIRQLEVDYLTTLDAGRDPKSYNLNNGGSPKRFKGGPWNKGKTYTYEELMGEETAQEVKQKISKSLKGKTYEELLGNDRAKTRKQKTINRLSGKTYEEIMGKEKAAEVKNKFSLDRKGKTSVLKGKTWDEIYGPERAQELRNIRSQQRKGKTYKELYGEENAQAVKNLQSLRHTERKELKSDAN